MTTTNPAETVLRLRCPVCERALRPLAASDAATEVRYQTCRGCHAPHTIKIVPLPIEGGMTHVVTFAATRSPK